MATKFFPTTGATTRTASSPASWPLATLRKLSLTQGAAATSVTDATIASLSTIPVSAGGIVGQWGAGSISFTVQSGTTAEGVNAATLIWISEPLNAVTVSGTITVNHRSNESNAMANYGAMAFVYKILAGNGAASKIGWAGNTTELGTTEAATSISIIPTSTALADGDMLAVVLGYAAAGGTSASGFTASGFYNGAAGATGDTFVSFTEAITEQTIPPPVVPLPHPALIYLRDNR